MQENEKLKEQEDTWIVINPEDTPKTTDWDLLDWVRVDKSEAPLTDEDTKLNNLLIAHADSIPHKDHDQKIAHLREDVLKLREKAKQTLFDTQTLRAACYALASYEDKKPKTSYRRAAFKQHLKESGFELLLENDSFQKSKWELSSMHSSYGLFVTALKKDDKYFILCKGTDLTGRDNSILTDFEENGPAYQTLQDCPIEKLYEEIIADHAKKHPTKSLKLHFIGHSLGGSVSSITASQWARKLQEAKESAELQLTLYQSAPVSQGVINKLDETCISAEIPLSVINLISSGDIVSKLSGGNWAAIESEYAQATMSTMPVTGHNQLPFASECEYSTPTNDCKIIGYTCSPKGYQLKENNFKQPPRLLIQTVQTVFAILLPINKTLQTLPLNPTTAVSIFNSPSNAMKQKALSSVKLVAKPIEVVHACQKFLTQ